MVACGSALPNDALLPLAGEGGRSPDEGVLTLDSTGIPIAIDNTLIRPSGTFSRKREKGVVRERLHLTKSSPPPPSGGPSTKERVARKRGRFVE
jgi:hypothetical protein